jgi:hypothetical protein
LLLKTREGRGRAVVAAMHVQRPLHRRPCKAGGSTDEVQAEGRHQQSVHGLETSTGEMQGGQRAEQDMALQAIEKAMVVEHGCGPRVTGTALSCVRNRETSCLIWF